MIVVSTNWTTVSREYPEIAPGHEYDAVMRYATLHQIGSRVTNTIAVFDWKGQPKAIILESTSPVYADGSLRRDISDSLSNPRIPDR